MGRNISGRTKYPLRRKSMLGGGSFHLLHTLGISGGGNNKNNIQPGYWSHFSNGDSGQLFAAETVYLLSKKSRSSSSPKNKQRWSWTKILLVTNIVVFLLQMATANQLLLMGAKVNELISSGQLYRLLTPIFLHGNIAHLMVNCYSLYSLGPVVERCFGSHRFIGLYLFSGFFGCAIFGLVGGFAVYLKRHQYLLGETSRLGLFSIAQSLIFNILMSLQRGSRIDNWGHLGGFLGGVFYSYLFGPNFERKRIGSRGVYLQDRPMIKRWFLRWKKNQL
ncbi:RHOMBOID-like protein 10, chloroplastic [Galdieria sulphuraria]|nr:RHOMBOID-like protein 10, chloroplastic [Galdieria sulphuraria]